MKKNEFKPMVIMALLAFTIFSCAGSTETNEDTIAEDEPLAETETLAEEIVDEDEVEYENMFNEVEATETYDLQSLLRMEDDLSTFAELLEASGLDTSIEFADPVTVFAPTNEAFEKLPAEQYAALTDPENLALLTHIIKAHILPNKVYFRQFDEDQVIQTSADTDIPVQTAGAQTPVGEPTSVVVGNAIIVKHDVEATNGIIHVVNEVIIPEETDDESTLGTYPEVD